MLIFLERDHERGWMDLLRFFHGGGCLFETTTLAVSRKDNSTLASSRFLYSIQCCSKLFGSFCECWVT